MNSYSRRSGCMEYHPYLQVLVAVQSAPIELYSHRAVPFPPSPLYRMAHAFTATLSQVCESKVIQGSVRNRQPCCNGHVVPWDTQRSGTWQLTAYIGEGEYKLSPGTPPSILLTLDGSERSASGPVCSASGEQAWGATWIGTGVDQSHDNPRKFRYVSNSAPSSTKQGANRAHRSSSSGWIVVQFRRIFTH
jgi:hypothetical protein